MTAENYVRALEFLSKPAGRVFLRALANDDVSNKDMLWQALGRAKTDEATEMNDLAELIQYAKLQSKYNPQRMTADSSAASASKGSAPKYSPEELRSIHEENLRDATERSKLVGNSLALSPQEIALDVAGAVVSNAARAGGDIANLNYASLASALMNGSRVSTDAQKNIYGLSNREKWADAVADRTRAKGKQWQRIGNAVADTADQIIGGLSGRLSSARELTAANLSDLSSGGFNYINGQAGRAERLRRRQHYSQGDFDI